MSYKLLVENLVSQIIEQEPRMPSIYRDTDTVVISLGGTSIRVSLGSWMEQKTIKDEWHPVEVDLYLCQRLWVFGMIHTLHSCHPLRSLLLHSLGLWVPMKPRHIKGLTSRVEVGATTTLMEDQLLLNGEKVLGAKTCGSLYKFFTQGAVDDTSRQIQLLIDLGVVKSCRS